MELSATSVNSVRVRLIDKHGIHWLSITITIKRQTSTRVAPNKISMQNNICR